MEDLHQLEIANLRKLGPFFQDAQNVIEKLVRGEFHSIDMFPYVISAKKQELEPFVKVKNKRIIFEKYRYSIAHVKPPYRQKHASFYGSNKAKQESVFSSEAYALLFTFTEPRIAGQEAAEECKLNILWWSRKYCL